MGPTQPEFLPSSAPEWVLASVNHKQLVILAGGKGTRLRERLGDLPKPMIPIGGRPLLEHDLQLAATYGFGEVLVLAGYRAEAILSYFGDGRRWGVRLRCEVED